MSYDNVKLWFAKDDKDNIITINEISESNKHNTYNCPMCGSKLIPKAVKSKQVSSHFAHVDVSQCGESMYHYWFKHKFLEKCDKFTVVSDKERNYVVEDVLVEQEFEVGDNIYRPDVAILTECGETIYFEMAFSNKKKVKDYIDIWLELKNIVVEVDIKTLMLQDKSPKFKALFYNGKCFNTKRNDTYYNTIGKYKEEKLSGKVDEKLKERIKKLDWFWEDVFRYKKGEVDIEHMTLMIDNVHNDDKEILNIILNKQRCVEILKGYIEHKINLINKYVNTNYGAEYLDYIKYENQYDYLYKTSEVYMILNRLGDDYYAIEMFENTYDELIEKIDKMILYNKEYVVKKAIIKSYNKKSDLIKNEIKQNKYYNEIKQFLIDKNNKYHINFEISRISISPLKISNNELTKNNFIVKFKLNYKENKYDEADNISFEICNIEEIESICLKMSEKFQKYFKELSVFSREKEVENIVNSINEKFEFCKLKIEHHNKLEDIYGIFTFLDGRYLKYYYLTNDGLLEYVRIKDDREYLLKTNNTKEIERYLTNDLEYKIKDEIKRKCVECKEHFTLEIGELKFFNKKGFDLPKRCKCCRNKHKVNKEELNEGK